ncbi:PAS-domain containing protein [Pseudotabrizicola algicola]|uniref:PAS domain-containing protein n=1 Tax=Pseudotabrizicola algicola TaxID=2709381 RepID=A0A6B3RTL1_9RHOB|nr:PAS-domain containing protein [Pseudotabrizicola algicola]NEX48118.1 PAS domain-containing protein [Pseudotabrizicola algicola]
MDSSFIFGLGIGLTAILAALGGILLLTALQANRKPVRESIFDERQKGALFLFDGDTLIDCTPGAQALLAASPAPGTAWVKLLAYLSKVFPRIEEQLSKLPDEGVVTLASDETAEQPLLVLAEQRGGLSRITIVDPETEGRGFGQDPLAHRSMTEELAFLQSMLSRAPFLAWREKDNGDIIWANTAYLLNAGDLLPPGKELTWPLPRLFDKTATQQGASGQRQKLRFPDGSAAWFDLISMPDGDGLRVYALHADSAVQAEATLRDFMQTLAKTFAHLPIGLAIFDSRRHLQLFNPALLDLTGLPPDFLSRRPSLLAVLDALRDQNMVPEPKDYRGWRKQITDMERAAASGVYEETWNLPGGQTYKVIGRPHPNGALALMIEDISNEITRTRRYRADLELGQSVIDSMDEAMAVFSETGILVMTNAAYAKLWGHDPAENLTTDGITSLARHWRSKTAPNGVWAEAEEFVCTIGDRTIWSDEVRMLDGRLISCRFTPLSAGATLVSFRAEHDTKDKLQFSAHERRSA